MVKCVGPTAGQPIIVVGIHWPGAILNGLASLPLVERWTSRDELLDEQGEERKAWEMARGQKDRVQGK
jgi:hypothetical protein